MSTHNKEMANCENISDIQENKMYEKLYEINSSKTWCN